MMGYIHNFGYNRAGLFGIFNFSWILIPVIIIFLFYFLYILLSENKNYSHHDNDALDILKMKYVQGEITEEEYLRKKNLIIKK